MVDAIGPKSVTASDRVVAPVVRATAAQAATTAKQRAAEPGIASAARAAAVQPPVDLERVALIKRAVANGTYPISPERVADRLIALSLDWRP